MSKFDNFVGLLGVSAGLVGLGYGLAMHTKMAKIGEKLDCSIEDLANKTDIDIPDDMIERAVEKAVNREVRDAVKKASDAAVTAVKRDIHKQVADTVEAEYSDIKDKVLEELINEAAKIDAKRVRADIEKAAKEIALEKFEANLDDILDKHNTELENVTKIYKAIADAVAPTNRSNDNEMVLRIAR